MRTLIFILLVVGLLLVPSVSSQDEVPEFETFSLRDQTCIYFGILFDQVGDVSQLADLCHQDVAEIEFAEEPLFSNLGQANRVELVITYAVVYYEGFRIYPESRLILYFWRLHLESGQQWLEQLQIPEADPGMFVVDQLGFAQPSALFSLEGEYRPVTAVNPREFGCFFSVNTSAEVDLSHCMAVFDQTQRFRPLSGTSEAIQTLVDRVCSDTEDGLLQEACSGALGEDLRQRGNQALDRLNQLWRDLRNR